VDGPRLRRQRRVALGRFRRGEVDHRVGMGEKLDRIVDHRDAGRIEPGQRADILADRGTARPPGAARKLAPFRRQNTAHQHLPHAPGAPNHPDLHRVPLPQA
jgi:hypothetical protein